MKKLMILGGAENQMQLIEAAKRENYYVVVCDYADECPGKALADCYRQVSIIDKEAVLACAREEKIDGVLSNSERAMTVVAYVSEKLGLVGNSEQSIAALNSKARFRELQERAGVYAPKHIMASGEEEFFAKLPQVPFPLVIKPCESSGSRGTTRFDAFDRQKMTEVYRECRDFSRDGLVAAEEFVTMPSLTVFEGDVFVYEDEYVWDGIFYDLRSSDAPMLPMADCYPIQEPPERVAAIHDTLQKIFQTAGVRFGEYNVEMYFTEREELFVIEINARQGGFGMPQYVQRCSGIDLCKLLVTVAVGDLDYLHSLKSYERPARFICQHIVFSHRDGVYQSLVIDDAIRPYVEAVRDTVLPGARVLRGVNAEYAIAEVDLVFPDGETQRRFFKEIEEHIYPVVE